MRLALAFFAFTAVVYAQVSNRDVLKLAQTRGAGLEAALRSALGEENLQKGTAAAGELGDFVFAVAAEKAPSLLVDDKARLTPFKAGALWVVATRLEMGATHKYTWLVNGAPFGGATNLPAFGPDSYTQPGVPVGKLTGPVVVPSAIYPNVTANVWWYVPAQWNGVTPLPVQIWGDGQSYTGARPGNHHALDVLDNLTAQGRIPQMVNVFIQPGTGQNQRSIEYDTVSDRFTRRLLDEILPVVAKSVPLRADAYSRAVIGQSSGAIMAFNAAYRNPDQFSRVVSWIGSYAALQTSPEHPVGGGEYPNLVRMQPKKNIRVWLHDNFEDQENARAGSWPLANIHMANSLKIRGYDYNFIMHVGNHNQIGGTVALPETLTWLWRGYDATKTAQEFEQDAAEKEQPVWQVLELNRK